MLTRFELQRMLLLLYFWLTLSHYQAVLETVARVKPKKNETKEEKYVYDHSCTIFFLLTYLVSFYLYALSSCNYRSFKFNQVFNLDNDNGAEETPTLIDRKVNNVIALLVP